MIVFIFCETGLRLPHVMNATCGRIMIYACYVVNHITRMLRGLMLETVSPQSTKDPSFLWLHHRTCVYGAVFCFQPKPHDMTVFNEFWCRVHYASKNSPRWMPMSSIPSEHEKKWKQNLLCLLSSGKSLKTLAQSSIRWQFCCRPHSKRLTGCIQ